MITVAAAAIASAAPTIAHSRGERPPLVSYGGGGPRVKANVTDTETLAPFTTTELGLAEEVNPGTDPIEYGYVPFTRPEKAIDVPVEYLVELPEVTDQFVPVGRPVSVNVAVNVSGGTAVKRIGVNVGRPETVTDPCAGVAEYPASRPTVKV